MAELVICPKCGKRFDRDMVRDGFGICPYCEDEVEVPVMTREEALDRYDRIRYNLMNHDDKLAVDVAFEALREQEDPKAILVQQYIKVPEKPKWISVEERLPERKDARHQRDFYLVALSNGTVKELAYEHDHYDNMLFDVGWHPTAYPVTHWMPLPDAPRDFGSIKTYLKNHEIEGLVFWKDGEPRCKIKRSDFGYSWPIKEDT